MEFFLIFLYNNITYDERYISWYIGDDQFGLYFISVTCILYRPL